MDGVSRVCRTAEKSGVGREAAKIQSVSAQRPGGQEGLGRPRSRVWGGGAAGYAAGGEGFPG